MELIYFSVRRPRDFFNDRVAIMYERSMSGGFAIYYQENKTDAILSLNYLLSF